VQNTSQNSAGPAPQLTSLQFDLSRSLLADVVFDPAGTAGDETAKCLEVGPTAAAVGYVTPADPCIDPFGQPFGDGYRTMSMAFDDFDGGEQLAMAVDIDPTSIKGAAGSGAAGSVSGLEMSGAIVTATFEGGQTLTGTMFGDGSKGGGQVALVAAPASPPSIGVQGSSVTALPSLSPVHDKVDVTTATVDVSLAGTPNAVVRLMKGPALMENGVFDVEPYEANTLTDAVFSVVTLSGAGTAVASVAVPLGLTYLIAVEGTEIPTNGLASRTLIVKRAA
jgi:hypothetical protein